MKSHPLYFVHGNGFPSPCYQVMLERLSSTFDCHYIERVGHDPDYPVTDNWYHLTQEVIANIQQHVSEPVIGVGHSLGGVLNVLAAIEKPELFKQVILLDSPLIGRIKSHVVRLSKRLGMIDSITPAYRTRYRRQHWPDRETALEYLRSKPLFRYFHRQCLEDYINFGLEKDEHGYTLRFNREIEYQIYRTLPHRLPLFKKKLITPTTLVYGKQSSVVDRFDLSFMKKVYGIQSIAIEGTHMFPLERPLETADLLMKLIEK